MKYIKFLMASAIIIGSGIMSNSAYCMNQNSVCSEFVVMEKLKTIFPGRYTIASIADRIFGTCLGISYDLHYLQKNDLGSPYDNVQLNVNDINSMFGLNIDNTDNVINYNEFINHLDNRIDTIRKNIVQRINNHIDDYNNTNKTQDNKMMLERRIIQALGDFYHSIKNIPNNFFELVTDNLKKHNLLEDFYHSKRIDSFKKRIDYLKVIIYSNNLEFKIIKYPKMVNQLETLYNELLNGKKNSNGNSIDGIPHDGHGDIIFDAKLLNNDIYDKIFDFAMNVINQINNSNNNNSQITENLLTLTKRCGSFSSGSQFTIAVLENCNKDDQDTIIFNREFNYEDLHQQTNGIFTLNNNVPDKVTFAQVMIYFSNRVEIQLLQVIRNIIHDLKNNNYFSANDIQNIINQNIQQNIDRIKQVMNAALNFIQSDNQLNNDATINKHITNQIQSAIKELRKLEKTALLDWQINVGLNDFPQNMGPNDLQMYMDKYVD